MDSVAWQPIGVDELQIGHFVRIGDRWFDHPFLQSSFRITTAEELAAIRAAGLSQILFDPARSRPVGARRLHPQIPVLQPAAAAEPPVLQPAVAPELAATVAAAVRLETRPTAAAPASPTVRPVSPAPPRAAPASDVRALRDNLSRSREDYRAAVDGAVQALAMLHAGDALGQEATRGAVRQVLALAAGRERPLTLAAIAAPVGAQRRQACLSMDAAALAAAVGRRLRLGAAELQLLTTAAMVHAVGLSRLPPRLHDESRLRGRDDLAEFRQYPRLGAAMLREQPGFAPEVIRIVEQHRERLDGSGFPAGARGEQIHPLAPIVGAIREFQVLATHDEPPRPAAALAGLYRTLRGAYGASHVEHLIAALTVYPPGTFVALSDGRIARVARVSDRARLAPLVCPYDAAVAPAEAGILDLSEPGHATVERVVDAQTLSAELRSWFGGEWAGLTFPAPVAPPMGARPPRPTAS